MNPTGTYELTGSEGYEAYLESIGVNAAERDIMASPQQTVTVKQEGDRYTLTTTTPTKTHLDQFTLGQEYVAVYGDGRQYKGISRRDGNRLIQQLHLGSAQTTTIHEFSDTGFQVMYLGVNANAKRTYKRLA
ncbi:hypothetical protein GCM10010331_16200 [Streptomyces xanthochromogenes]|uniref:lipocalin/fatty-acid binding family protein n=1 Tax=Streptomyces xanthochromogenes TaxID=67384 RepID=UPI00167B2026|nr:lipocalin/fatty-acid binding family protein [Streptomyces xanthochromogenes]GHB30563.1 hypothetical protein GCM10010331_16200 [Streptomyces xanthochromogenes]